MVECNSIGSSKLFGKGGIKTPCYAPTKVYRLPGLGLGVMRLSMPPGGERVGIKVSGVSPGWGLMTSFDLCTDKHIAAVLCCYVAGDHVFC